MKKICVHLFSAFLGLFLVSFFLFSANAAESGKTSSIKAVKQRLQELGYYPAGMPLSEKEDRSLSYKIRLFQSKNELPTTGEIDDDFLSALFSKEANKGSFFEDEKEKSSDQNTATLNRFSGAQQMRVQIDASCNDLNHVGNKWEIEVYINDEIVQENEIVSFRENERIFLMVHVEEVDKYSDISETNDIHIITSQDLINGFSIPFMVTVIENRGRYIGNQCIWHVRVSFSTQDI